MAITIKQIARITGTSTTAVSFVLNGKDHGLVSAAKKNLILKTIRQSGYKQNNLARGLQAQRTFRVAVCVPGFFDEHAVLGNFSTYDAISRMMHRFSERGYSVEWLQIPTGAGAREIIRRLRNASVDGFVFVKWPPAQLAPLLPAIRRHKLPAVCLNALLESAALPSCGYSRIQAAETGTQYLIDAGRKNIALIDYMIDETHPQHRKGYLQALRRARRKPLIHVQSPDRRVDNVMRIAERFLAAHPAVDGILTTENFYALFLGRVLQGRDILLASIGDSCFAELQRPKLVHLALPMRAMADWCAQTLVTQIETHKLPRPTHQQFPCEIVTA